MHSTGQHNYPLMLVSILLTAVCWGSYGPLLLWGHQAMGSGRLRPFICVGIAYFLIAIIGPILIMQLTGMEKDNGLASGWNFTGTMWSLAGGAVGAVGAFGIILALNYGGHPTLVMPLVFGIAPVVNTLISLTFARGTLNTPGPMYYAGLILVGVGAVTVLFFQPSRKAPVKAPTETKAAVSPLNPPKDAAADSNAIDPPQKNA